MLLRLFALGGFKLLFLQHPLAEATGLPNKFQNRRFVRQPIQQRGGHFLVAKQVIPFAKAQIGGDDDRDALIQVITQLEEELASSLENGINPSSSRTSRSSLPICFMILERRRSF